MTVDPRVEAAAREVRRVVKGEDVNGWARRVLAAADAVERPVAQRLAEALNRIAFLALEANEEYEESCRLKVDRISSTARGALAEWDATQEQTT